MSYTQITQEIIDHLRKLGNKEVMPALKEYGICCELYVKFEFYIDVRDFKRWSKFSGSTVHPVPHPNLNNPAKAYYFHDDELKNQWLDDEYGDNRRDLCLYLADIYESRLNNSCK